MAEENTNEDSYDDGNDFSEEEVVEEEALTEEEESEIDSEEDENNSEEDENDSEEDDSEDDDQSRKDKKEARKRTQQEKIDYAFSKKQKQLQEEKRLRAEAEEKVSRYERELQKFKIPKRPEIPEMPDIVDPQYKQKLALREQTIKHQVMYDQKLKMYQHHQKQQQKNQHNQRLNELQQKTVKYAERSKDFGINDEDAKKYEDSIAPFISPKNAKMAEYLLDHEQGPLIVKYLSKNPIEMEKLASMSDMNAAVYIETKLAEKAKDSKPKTSKTPPPGKTLKGKSGTNKHAALDGASFE